MISPATKTNGENAMETITYKITGEEPLLLNNPRTVDPFDHFAKAKKIITAKRKKTDDDLLELRRLEVEAKVYFDDEIGIFVPATWVSAAIAGRAWKQCKIAKSEIRSAVFPVERRIKLGFDGDSKVKSPADISGNSKFVTTMLLKQGQVKLAKCAPIFHNWSFSSSLEFDPSIIDRSSLCELLSDSSSYGGFGDFRPTYGRATFSEI